METSDFTWSTTYRGYIVPNYSVLLKKFPPLINIGKTFMCLNMMSVPTIVRGLIDLIEVVHKSETCKGNFDNKCTSLPTIHGGILMNQSSKLM